MKNNSRAAVSDQGENVFDEKEISITKDNSEICAATERALTADCGENALSEAAGETAVAEAAALPAAAGNALGGVDGNICGENENITDNENKEEKRKKVYALCFLAILASLTGWIGENVVELVSKGVLDSRYHVFPFIPVYALIVPAFYLLLGEPGRLAFFGKKIFVADTKKSRALSDLIALSECMLFAFCGELIVGNFWEKVTGVVLWDYSGIPLSVTRYAGFFPALGYGGGAFLLFRFVYAPALEAVRSKMNFRALRIIVWVLGAMIIFDAIRFIVTLFVSHKTLRLWSIKLFR